MFVITVPKHLGARFQYHTLDLSCQLIQYCAMIGLIIITSLDFDRGGNAALEKN